MWHVHRWKVLGMHVMGPYRSFSWKYVHMCICASIEAENKSVLSVDIATEDYTDYPD